MIITRTPLRITLAGGGTDFPPHVARNGGFAITAAIDKHVYVAATEMFDEGYRIRYAVDERVVTVDEIQHPIVREALHHYAIKPGFEVASFADIPAGTGLGSSAAFTVGLLRAIGAHRSFYMSREGVAERAVGLELNRLGRPGGKQDHYACALGGVQRLWFRPDGKVRAESVQLDWPVEDYLALYFTGVARGAETILTDQTVEGLAEIQEIGHCIDGALADGDVARFGELMHEHWVAKKRRHAGMTTRAIDDVYEVALQNGAIGGKLVGAGRAGFLLFVVEDRVRLRNALRLREVPFRFDPEGVTVL